MSVWCVRVFFYLILSLVHLCHSRSLSLSPCVFSVQLAPMAACIELINKTKETDCDRNLNFNKYRNEWKLVSRTSNGHSPNRETIMKYPHLMCVCHACERAFIHSFVRFVFRSFNSCPYDRFWHVAQKIKPNDFIYNQSITLYMLISVSSLHERKISIPNGTYAIAHEKRYSQIQIIDFTLFVCCLLPWLTLPYDDGSWKPKKKRKKSDGFCWMNCEDSSRKIIHSRLVGPLIKWLALAHI